MQKRDSIQPITSTITTYDPATKNGAARCLKRQRDELADKIGRKVCWQKGNDYDISLVNDLMPIGPEDECKKTLAIDTEGLTVNGTALQVSLAGYFTTRKGGARSIWSSYIKSSDYRNLTTPISGLHANDIQSEGIKMESVKNILFLFCSENRICTWDQNGEDLKRLNITQEELTSKQIEWVNVQKLYGGVSLEKAVNYMFPASTSGLARDQVKAYNGHSADADARFTIRLYRKFWMTKEMYGDFPVGNDLRSELIYLRTIEDWIKGKTETVLNGGRKM